MSIKNKNISFQANALLNNLIEDKRVCFDIDTAYKILSNSSRDAVKKLLSDMTKRGLLMRIKESLYYIIPFEHSSETFMPDWHLLSQYLAGNAEYYIGYFSALQIHSLTTQPHFKEQIVVNKQIKPSTLFVKEIPFQFIYHNEKHFFGNKKMWIDSFHRVQCSDLEKTIIDCLFKPEYAGGITEIAKAIYKIKDKIDDSKILQYAKLFDSQAVIKRLGFMLELLEFKCSVIEELQTLRTNSVVLLEPSYPKKGKTISRWAIQQNIDTESILLPIYS
jgi:predicted transcriptional regulator of viral defense system